MLDWQTILVTLFILAAALYVARRGLSRLRSFRAGKRNSSTCETGCGCSGVGKQAGAAQQKTFS
ncbi:MAG TPA: hypothetical protein VGO69_08605, partial [Pyrinomonadaceae bacterium]|nr:hypothetical protein [Pyrinomonadaceae bacterium]